MRSELLAIGHKDILVPRLKALNMELSEYTFANLYLFRGNHHYELIFDKEIFLKGYTYDGHSYLMPTADLRRIDIDYLKGLLKNSNAEFFFPIPEAWVAAFKAHQSDAIFVEGDADYVYAVEKLSTYRGRAFHKKRNLLKQFIERYSHEARPLTNDRLDDARFVLNDWISTSGMNPPDTDYASCLEALDRYEELVLCGGIYYADNEPAGFILGEELNPATFVLHFAKARTRFKGIYQYMFNNFAGILPPSYRYLNLEQDLDKENLRVFKSSYLPDVLVKKARVRFP